MNDDTGADTGAAIEELLGVAGRAEMIHRDDLVLKGEAAPEPASDEGPP